jgi:hypothetical protein
MGRQPHARQQQNKQTADTVPCVVMALAATAMTTAITHALPFLAWLTHADRVRAGRAATGLSRDHAAGGALSLDYSLTAPVSAET